MGSLIEMSGTFAGGTESNVASIDIAQSGFLLGVQWACTPLLDAAAELFEAQVSFGSQASGTNDARQVISAVRATLGLGAAGAYVVAINLFVPLPEVPLFPGERIYLHGISTAGVTGIIRCFLHLSFDEPSSRVRRQ